MLLIIYQQKRTSIASNRVQIDLYTYDDNRMGGLSLKFHKGQSEACFVRKLRHKGDFL